MQHGINNFETICSKMWTKLANALFGQKKQHFAPFPKLIREIPLF